MLVRVPGERFGMTRLGNLLPRLVMADVKPQLVEQLVRSLVRNQVPIRLEELFLAVVPQIIGDEQRAAAQRLEDAHVNVVLDAPVNADPRLRVDPGKLVEIALADERVRKLLLHQLQEVLARARPYAADKTEVPPFGERVRSMDGRVARQGQPVCGNPGPVEPRRPVPLRGEQTVEM